MVPSLSGPRAVARNQKKPSVAQMSHLEVGIPKPEPIPRVKSAELLSMESEGGTIVHHPVEYTGYR